MLAFFDLSLKNHFGKMDGNAAEYNIDVDETCASF